ncbi:MAG: purine-nucleoside phosphorylase [Bacteroidetes bacterium]|nr:purine-nucleoside phosphorylase [Bacteroidota bacterium]
MTAFEKVMAAAAYIRDRSRLQPPSGVVLGSGLANFRQSIFIEIEVPYVEIPHFPHATVQGHGGSLILGYVAGRPIAALSGRLHFYEGHSPADVIFPIRVLGALGVRTLLVSNAAGGVNPYFSVGDIMLITDHISLATINPLIGPNEEAFGARFPDMSEPYSRELIQLAEDLAPTLGLTLHKGVYFGVTGPTYETRAEYRMIRLLGADAVGMSTVQETIAAVQLGMRVFALSVITDIGIREEENLITHEEVLQAAQLAEPRMAALFTALIERI